MGKLLVTGAMGHVGYETVKQALSRGHEVIGQVNHTFREADAQALGEGVTWVRCNLADPFEVAMLAAEHDIDGCIHPAAIPNDKMGLPQPLNTFRSNVDGTVHLLETARRRQWRRFLLISTGAVFQEWKDKEKPIPETEPPTPKTLYGGTKRAAEIMTEIYANMYQLSAASIRISWVFGPPLVPSSFEGPRGPVPEFLRRVLRGEVVREESGGDFAASFTYVTDCALGSLAAYEAQSLSHHAYHLGSGENYTTHRVVEAIRAAVPDADISVGPGAAPWTDFTVLRGPLDCSRMVEDFGFTPRYTLEQAIAEFADWMRANPASFS